MTDEFTEAQSLRDFHARDAGQVGECCLRWSTCGRCGWEWHTGEAVPWMAQDKAEDDHEHSGCTWTPPERELVDPDLGWWTNPDTSYHWVQRMAPAPETTGDGSGSDFTRGLGWVAGRRAPVVLRMKTLDTPEAA